jgi:hypothetical protein
VVLPVATGLLVHVFSVHNHSALWTSSLYDQRAQFCAPGIVLVSWLYLTVGPWYSDFLDSRVDTPVVVPLVPARRRRGEDAFGLLSHSCCAGNNWPFIHGQRARWLSVAALRIALSWSVDLHRAYEFMPLCPLIVAASS